MKLETKCIQAGYEPKNGESRMIPIIQSTTFKYDTSEDMGKLFDLEASGYFYTRLQNPTNDLVAAKLCALEGGTAAMLTSSGQAANFFAVFNIAQNGDHVVASSAIYGGTFNLFNVTMRKMGIEFTFVSPDCTEEELEAAFRTNTKCVFGESIANPALTVLDFEKFAKAAHAHGVPLIVDNTFPTPINCRPIEFGVDIVTHSTTKYLNGHSDMIGGVAVVGENEALRDQLKFLQNALGAISGPFDSFLALRGLKTLALRMERHCASALRIARWLESREDVERVIYPGLESHPQHDLAKRQMHGFGGIVTVVLKRDLEATRKVLERTRLFTLAESLGGVESLIEHPAIMTHASIPAEQRAAIGITDGLIRLSVGIEDCDDLIADLNAAFAG